MNALSTNSHGHRDQCPWILKLYIFWFSRKRLFSSFWLCKTKFHHYSPPLKNPFGQPWKIRNWPHPGKNLKTHMWHPCQHVISYIVKNTFFLEFATKRVREALNEKWVWQDCWPVTVDILPCCSAYNILQQECVYRNQHFLNVIRNLFCEHHHWDIFYLDQYVKVLTNLSEGKASSLNNPLRKNPLCLKLQLQKTDSTRHYSLLHSIFDKCSYNCYKLNDSAVVKNRRQLQSLVIAWFKKNEDQVSVNKRPNTG